MMQNVGPLAAALTQMQEKQGELKRRNEEMARRASLDLEQKKAIEEKILSLFEKEPDKYNDEKARVAIYDELGIDIPLQKVGIMRRDMGLTKKKARKTREAPEGGEGRKRGRPKKFSFQGPAAPKNVVRRGRPAAEAEGGAKKEKVVEKRRGRPSKKVKAAPQPKPRALGTNLTQKMDFIATGTIEQAINAEIRAFGAQLVDRIQKHIERVCA